MATNQDKVKELIDLRNKRNWAEAKNGSNLSTKG